MNWEVEFLKHLRTNHFALVGALVALLVAMTLAQNAQFRRAYDEFLTLNTVITKYFSFDNMHKVADAGNIDFFATPDRYEVTYKLDRLMEDITDTIAIRDTRRGVLRIGSRGWGNTPFTKGPRFKLPIFSNDPGTFGVDSLAQFAQIWDFLGKAQAFYVKSMSYGGLRAFGSDGEVWKPPVSMVLDKSLAADDFVDATFGIVEQADSVRTFAQRNWYIVVDFAAGSNISLHTLYIPVEVYSTGQLTSQNVVVPYTDTSVPIGTFADAFGDLHDTAKGLESLALEDLGPYLRQKVDGATDQISVFGVEVPISSIDTWGLILILVFQFYFTTDLRRYLAVETTGEQMVTFPWIGVYPDSFSRAAFFLSSSVLPAVDAVYAFFKSAAYVTFSVQNLLISMSAFAVIGMSLYTGYQTLAFQRRTDALRHALAIVPPAASAPHKPRSPSRPRKAPRPQSSSP